MKKLVAARKSSKSSLNDMQSDPTSSVYSCSDSGFYSVSDCSTPPTPSYPARGHLRYPSSTSSLSSSPPTFEPFEAPNASGKLPKLTEEPLEPEEDYVMAEPERFSYEYDCDDPQRSSIGEEIEAAWNQDYFSGPESHAAKRRRSMQSSAHSITNKIENRFPSFSRKVRSRKRASTLAISSGNNTPSGAPSRTASMRGASTRSSSISSSIHKSQGFDVTDKLTAINARGSKERLEEAPIPSSPIDIAKANAYDPEADQEDSERFATTPLLPPLLVKTRADDQPTESPLQSPTVANPAHSHMATPVSSPQVRSYPTPPLSSQPSVASFRTSRPGYTVPSADIPPIKLEEKKDGRWAATLGHADFTIQPEPYLPDDCDVASLRLLFADWEQARCNYTKHQVRTAEHHGVTSKTYMLTEQKWAEIDALWKKNNDLAISRAAAVGQEIPPISPVEPAPLSKMPSLNDPRSEGKFPKLGDEDIVGPMVQIAAQIQTTSSRKRAFFKFFSDMKFPGSLFGKSSVGFQRR